jgi:hypothetical protein
MAGPFGDEGNPRDWVPKCGIKGKQNGLPCKALAMANGRCRMHGGTALYGKDHNWFMGNRYQADITGPLLEKYLNAVNDPEILNLSEEIAVLQARLSSLLADATGNGQSGMLADKQLEVWRALMGAKRRRDGATYAEKLDELGELFKEGSRLRGVWEEIYEAMDMLRKLQHREQRRRVEMHAMLTSEQAVGLMAEMVNLVYQNVPDTEARLKVRDGMRDILQRRPELTGAAKSRALHKERSDEQRRQFVEMMDAEKVVEASVVHSD